MNRICVVVMLLALSGAAAAVDGSKLAGTWRSEQKAMIGHGTAYLTFDPQGTCTQVATGVMLGVTKWQALQCKWTTDADALTVTVTGPASLKDAIGKTVRYKVTELSDRALTLEADGHTQKSERVDAMPAEFVAHLTAP